jgi:hypothetical protein
MFNIMCRVGSEIESKSEGGDCEAGQMKKIKKYT